MDYYFFQHRFFRFIILISSVIVLSLLATINVNSKNIPLSFAHTPPPPLPENSFTDTVPQQIVIPNYSVNQKQHTKTLPMPTITIDELSFIPTALVYSQNNNTGDTLNFTLLDEFIRNVSPNVRHYPPNFNNRSQRYYIKEKIKDLINWITPYASQDNASFDVLLRTAKLNIMARNLDLGSEYSVNANNAILQALKLRPNHAEANFLYGMMLSEGGGFKEGQVYLEKAANMGYMEAEQSLAQSDLLNDKRDAALARLKDLQRRYPNNSQLKNQIELVEDGKYYIWNLSTE